MQVLVVGGCGYIGSSVVQKLKNEHNNLVSVVDLIDGDGRRYQDLTPDEICEFDVVVWLAGHSSVSKAISDPVGALRNNLVDLYEFGRKLSAEQVMIYASSASVYNRPDASLAFETDELRPPLNVDDLSKKWFDEIVLQLGCQTYGLRFGTVSGLSPNMREDLIINAMVKSGLQNGYVTVRNESKWRSILGITDLFQAINSIKNECPEAGIYNVASESATIGEIGNRVATVLGVPLKIESSDGTYNFQISTIKLQKCTTWRPMETVESLSADLLRALSL